MFRCNLCDASFESPVRRQVRPDNRIAESEEWHVCPICGDDDIEKLTKCPMCRLKYIKSDQDRCDFCRHETAYWMNDGIDQIGKHTGAERDEIIQAIVYWVEHL